MTQLYLVATVAGRRVAFRTAQIHSVIDVEAVTPVPGTPPCVAGLSALRSRPLTVIDCAVALGQAEEPIPPVKALVVNQNGFLYALSVEDVEDVVWIESEAEPLPAGRHGGWEQAALGMVSLGGEMLLLADPTAVLDSIEAAPTSRSARGLAPAPNHAAAQ
ncbi:chemotaxis protein CheW [Alteraurantiacibacter palmitatis]|uniref:Chemotaxis protein CheW n=1 Tax=Alteraurantiacibacter palmitatis TaxID=2054628 RepID=A0ABV7E3D3_9SPHN